LVGKHIVGIRRNSRETKLTTVVLGSGGSDAAASEVEERVGIGLEFFVVYVGTNKGNISAGEQLLGIVLDGGVGDARGLAGKKRVSKTGTESSVVCSLDSNDGGGSVSVSRFQSCLLANIDEFVILELLVGDDITQNLGELSSDGSKEYWSYMN
jgi:hypothetical protein